MENQVDKDVLLFEGSFHKGLRRLVKCTNKYSGQKHKKAEYEDSFKRLASFGIGAIKEKKATNNTKYLHFTKKSVQEIASDPKSLDKFPKDVSFEEYDMNFNA